MTDQSPPAHRLARPRWLDSRLLLGLLLVLVAVVVGAKVVGGANHSQRVWVTTHALVPGEHLTAGDLTVGHARLYGRGDRYVLADGAVPDGNVVTRAVGSGELLPFRAVSSHPGADHSRLVTLPVSSGHYPAKLGHGDNVDVYVTPEHSGNKPAGQPRRVLSAAAVQSRDGGSRNLASAASTVSVVLAVPTARVPTVVAAAHAGAIDLVRVPAGAGRTLASAGHAARATEQGSASAP
jgi:hypothetical protein